MAAFANCRARKLIRNVTLFVLHIPAIPHLLDCWLTIIFAVRIETALHRRTHIHIEEDARPQRTLDALGFDVSSPTLAYTIVRVQAMFVKER
eukprot:924799-Karenia_brevis.AAC.1